MDVHMKMEANHTACLNGASVEEYNYSEADFILPGITWQERKEYGESEGFLSQLDSVLRCKWVEKMKQGLFRYPLWNLETRILPGTIKYVAQLNIKRGMERRKPQDIQSIREKFNASQFNFNKINPKEILFLMTKSSGENAVVKDRKYQGSLFNKVTPATLECKSGNVLQKSPKVESTSRSTLVVINVSPLEFGHVLFIPDPSLCLTQILTCDLMLFGLESVLLSAHPGFRVGFNSLGGFASVNHLHLHGFYLDHELLIESSSSKPLSTEHNLYLLTQFPAPGFMFYTDGKDLEAVAQNICQITDYFVEKNIAHNIFLTRGSDPAGVTPSDSRGGLRIVIWPRKSCFGAKEEAAFNVALCELAGHLPMKNLEDFNNITEESVIRIIKNYLFSDDDFNEISSEVLSHLTKSSLTEQE
ncbi:GDP-D-glucose phosphorylase 1 [Spea bombifrons]|uniref:GDP-D-glucose phosphorylase 1 n=1 Tax=Spea bombifrons TaxID=233779 RepID=UPI00234B67AC|nr:GDP-D-glucose phosphorylase 1 [Spea bombifrons]